MPENIDDAKGQVKEAAGDLTNDRTSRTRARSTGDWTVKDKVGDAADKVKDTIRRD